MKKNVTGITYQSMYVSVKSGDRTRQYSKGILVFKVLFILGIYYLTCL